MTSTDSRFAADLFDEATNAAPRPRSSQHEGRRLLPSLGRQDSPAAGCLDSWGAGRDLTLSDAHVAVIKGSAALTVPPVSYGAPYPISAPTMVVTLLCIIPR